jgi:hypothetical protein
VLRKVFVLDREDVAVKRRLPDVGYAEFVEALQAATHQACMSN